MSGLAFYIIDLETNGLCAKNYYNEVIEISIIRATDRVQLSRTIRCEFPERSNYDALAITKKTLADLELGVEKNQAVEDCIKFFNEDNLTPQHRCIVGHNIITFDKKFLFALWENVGKIFPATLWLDTLQMIRLFTKQIGLKKPKTNLHAACDIAGVKKLADSHNARVDSRNTYLLWRNLIDEKKMDYLPLIKTAQHISNTAIEENAAELDISINGD